MLMPPLGADRPASELSDVSEMLRDSLSLLLSCGPTLERVKSVEWRGVTALLESAGEVVIRFSVTPYCCAISFDMRGSFPRGHALLPCVAYSQRD